MKANSRVDELEKLIAEKAQRAQPAVESLPKIAASTLATLEQFLALPAAEQANFSQQGRKLSIAAINALPLALKVRHLELGGQIGADAGDQVTRIASRDPIRANSKIMRLQPFAQLGKASRLALIRNGLIISA